MAQMALKQIPISLPIGSSMVMKLITVSGLKTRPAISSSRTAP
ncbi:MAG: hypothetical protein ACFFB5_20145 [Promethearchaeota archaeon]